MYTIASNEITSRIENYKALWGMWIEDAQSEAPVHMMAFRTFRRTFNQHL